MAKMQVKKRNGRWRAFTLVLGLFPVQVYSSLDWRQAYDVACRYHWVRHQGAKANLVIFDQQPRFEFKDGTYRCHNQNR